MDFMEIIIDAYNLLKQLTNGPLGEWERSRFISTMQSYAHKKQHTVTIVFDGGSYERPFLEDFDDITVVYSGFKLTADDYIKNLLPRLYPNNALIVTADRAICHAADNHNITSINPPDFMRFVHKAVNTAMHVVMRSKDKPKPLHASAKDHLSIDELMEAASNVIIDKDQMIEHDETHDRRAPKKVLSKTERKLETIVKKL
jgi:predicted RNA-binding protein with PIN domain